MTGHVSNCDKTLETHSIVGQIIIFHHSQFPNWQPPTGDDRQCPSLTQKPARGIPLPDVNSACTPTIVRHTKFLYEVCCSRWSFFLFFKWDWYFVYCIALFAGLSPSHNEMWMITCCWGNIGTWFSAEDTLISFPRSRKQSWVIFEVSSGVWSTTPIAG